MKKSQIDLYTRKIDASKYATLPVTGVQHLQLTEEEFKAGKAGYYFLPYQIITPYAEISGPGGTKRIRQISRWRIFKLWVCKIYNRITGKSLRIRI